MLILYYPLIIVALIAITLLTEALFIIYPIIALKLRNRFLIINSIALAIIWSGKLTYLTYKLWIIFLLLQIAQNLIPFQITAPISIISLLLTPLPRSTVIYLLILLACDRKKFSNIELPQITFNQKEKIRIGNQKIPEKYITRSLILIGSPGTGKSIAIEQVLQQTLEKTAMICDVSSIFSEKYGSQNDIILTLNSKINWTPLSEIESPIDAMTISKSLIPDKEGEAEEWNFYAQSLLTSILITALEKNLSHEELSELLVTNDLDLLKSAIGKSPCKALLTEGNERMLGSVRAIIGTYLNWWNSLSPTNNPISIRKIIQNEKRVYICYTPTERNFFRNLISSWIDIASNQLLSMTPNPSRKVLFIIDEIPLIGKINSLPELLSNGRKYGLVLIAGLQSISQFKAIYGNATTESILTCFGNWIILRNSEPETAEYLSRKIGSIRKTKVTESAKNLGMTWQASSRTETTTELVLPSEIMQLKDLNGFLITPDTMKKIKLNIPK